MIAERQARRVPGGSTFITILAGIVTAFSGLAILPLLFGLLIHAAMAVDGEGSAASALWFLFALLLACLNTFTGIETVNHPRWPGAIWLLLSSVVAFFGFAFFVEVRGA